MIYNHTSQFWFWKKAIDKETCNDIIELGLSRIDDEGAIGENRSKAKKSDRRSRISWLEDSWLYDLVSPYINGANENAGWNFKLDWFEPIQFTKYLSTEKGHYNWHIDINKPYGTDRPDWKGKQRKLSTIISLSDEDDYEGGDFEFNFKNKQPGLDESWPVPELKKQGSVVVFPAYHWHRVKPITKGTRYSLVIWSLGERFC